MSSIVMNWWTILATFVLCPPFVISESDDTLQESTNPPRFIQHPQSQIVKQHGKVQLECAASSPNAHITWRYNNEPLDAASAPGAGIEIQGRKLTIASFRHSKRENGESHEGVYTCVAENNVGAVVSEAAVLQRAFLGQFSSDLEDIQMNATSGNTALIPCQPPKGTPSPRVFFQFNGQIVDPTSGRHLVLPSGNMQILSVKQADAGIYRCVSVNPLTGQQRLANSHVTLNVISPTQKIPPRYVQKPEEIYEVIQGSNLTLECVVQGSPVPVIEWGKHQGELPIRRVQKIGEGNLLIRDVQMLDQGIYICRARNGIGPDTAAIAEVRVLEPPSIRIEPADQTAIEGVSVHLQCAARGQGVRVTWLYDAQPINTSENIQITESSLTITRVTKQQSGIYQCVAESKLGRVTSAAHLQVKGQGEVDFTWPQNPNNPGFPGMEEGGSNSAVPRPFISIAPSNTTADAGHIVILPCNAQLGPDPSPSTDGEPLPPVTDDQIRIKYVWFHTRPSSRDDDNDDVIKTQLQQGNNNDEYDYEYDDADYYDYDVMDAADDDVRSGAAAAVQGDDVISGRLDLSEERFSIALSGTLRIDGVRARDEGVFTCVALNAGGSADASAYLNVIDSNTPSPSDPTDMSPGNRRNKNNRDYEGDDYPSPPIFGENMIPPSAPAVTRHTENSALLRWTVPENDGLPIEFFKIQYRDIDAASREERRWRTEEGHILPDARQAEVRGLKPGATYKFRVLAVYSNDDNAWGENSRRFKLDGGDNVDTAAPVTQPIITELRSLGSDNLALSWQYQSQDLSPIEGFIVYYKKLYSNEPFKSQLERGQERRNTNLYGLEPNTHYSVKVSSFNEAGVGPVSVDAAERTLTLTEVPKPDQVVPTYWPKPKPYLTTTRAPYGYVPRANNTAGNEMMYVLLGVLLGAILLIVLICMLVCWRRQRKHRQRMENEADHAKFGDPSKTIYADSLRKLPANGGSHFLLSDLGPHSSNGGVHNNGTALPRNGSLRNGHVTTAAGGQFTMMTNPMNDYANEYDDSTTGIQSQQDLDFLRASLQNAFHPPASGSGAPPPPPERGMPSYTAAEYAHHPHNPYFEVDPNADTLPRVHMGTFGCQECKYGSRPQSRTDNPYPYGGNYGNAPPPEYNSLRHPHNRLSGCDYPADYATGSLRRPKTNPHVGYDSGYRASPDHIPRSHERPPYRSGMHTEPYPRSAVGINNTANTHSMAYPQHKLYDPYPGSSQDTAYGSALDHSGNMSDVYEQLGSEKSYSSSSQVSGRPKQRRKNKKAPVPIPPHLEPESIQRHSPVDASVTSVEGPPRLPPRNTPPYLNGLSGGDSPGINNERQSPPVLIKEKPIPASRRKLSAPNNGSDSSSRSGGEASSESPHHLDSTTRSGTNDTASMSPQVSLGTRAHESDLDLEQVNVSDNEGAFTMTDSHVSSSIMDDEEEEDIDGALDEELAACQPLFSTPAAAKAFHAPPLSAPPLASPIITSVSGMTSAEVQPLMSHIPRVNDYPSDEDES